MSEPVWLPVSILLALHDRQLAEHGGAAGVRNLGLLESAVARPRNLFAYGEEDLATLAAAYAFGIMRNHPFVDGNKRTGFIAAELFLAANGLELVASDEEALAFTLGLAGSEIGEAEYAAWLKANSAKR